jgi:hypothetical protein
LNIRKTIIVIVCLLIGTSISHAQLSGLRSQTFVLPSDSIKLDTLPLVFGSVYCHNCESQNDFKIDYINSSLHWLSNAIPDTLRLSWRVLTAPLQVPIQHKDKSFIEDVFTENPFSYVPSRSAGATDILPGNNLRTIGNISRGIGFGNNQDVVVNSNLNLRMAGTLADDIQIRAVISDENNPIQPEGNTQQLQDFDQVYIQLSRDSSFLTVGDFLMQSPSYSYFLKYYKRSRGLQLGHQWKAGKGRMSFDADAAVSRGRFSRNVFPGEEGNQGPYRLTGANGEVFIIVISGTEAVYLDGELLTRGEQHDYVIDYNSGEVTFTPNRMITRYSRIIVEFQYSDRNYARSVVQSGLKYQRGQWLFDARVFSEQDHKNQSFQQSLEGYDSLSGQSAIDVLRNVGDRVNEAFIPRVRRLNEFNPDRIMYRREVLPQGDTIYVYSQNPEEDSVFYELIFSFVGNGNGSYQQLTATNANGRVYEWVGPGAGNYEPVEQLVSPRSQQMLQLSAMRAYGKANFVKVEWSGSRNDLNTFSDLNSQDDLGSGIHAQWRHHHAYRSKQDSSIWWKGESGFILERVDSNFRFVERYRDVEFDRIWNRQLQNPDNSNAREFNRELISQFYTRMQRGNNLNLDYDVAFYDKGQDFTGFRNKADARWRPGKNDIYSRLETVSGERNVSGNEGSNRYLKWHQGYNRSFNLNGGQSRLEAGGSWLRERSAIQGAEQADSLFNNSFWYDQFEVRTQFRDSGGWDASINANSRQDYLPAFGEFSPSTLARTLSAQTGKRGSGGGNFRINGTYRSLEITDSTEKEETIQGRIDWNSWWFKRLIRSSMFYQLGTGREQRREFNYFKVQPGNGVYIWNDYDSNGITGLNEFEIASELDRPRADYIRVFVPVPGFINTNVNQFNQSIFIQPSARWKERPKGWKGLPLRFSNLTALRVDRKLQGTDLLALLNPLNVEVADSQLISTATQLRNVLYFNRSGAVFGMDWEWQDRRNKGQLVNGFELRTRNFHRLQMRWNISSNWDLQAGHEWGESAYLSEFFLNRNFDYEYQKTDVRFAFQQRSEWRLSLLYEYFYGLNDSVFGAQQSIEHKLGFELRKSSMRKGTINASFNYVGVNYRGEASSAVAYELLRGLQDGNNFVWNLNIQRQVSKSIQLLLNYDGRTSQNSPIIHIGRVQARYIF